MRGKRGSSRRRSLTRVSVIVTACLALAVVAGLPSGARAASTSHIYTMPFGPFQLATGESTSWGASISCTDSNGCTGVLGLNFPGIGHSPWAPLAQVTGSFVCPSSGDPSSCAIHVESDDVFDCVITVPASPTPGLSNPVSIDCTNPAGSGTGIATVVA